MTKCANCLFYTGRTTRTGVCSFHAIETTNTKTGEISVKPFPVIKYQVCKNYEPNPDHPTNIVGK